MIRKITLLFIILLTAHTGFSQKNNTSPYSFFGIGEESADKTVEEMSMGETGVTYFNPIQLTFSNPASLAALQLTSYTLGVENKRLTSMTGSTKAQRPPHPFPTWPWAFLWVQMADFHLD